MWRVIPVLAALWSIGTSQVFACDLSQSLPNTARAIAAHDGMFRVFAIGSSSTGGVGAGGKEAAYPQQIPPVLRPWGLIPDVTARGVGGERAAGALRRLPRAMAQTRPDLVIWQVGTNDANARLDPDDVARTIRSGVALIRAAEADAILVDPQFYPRIAGKAHYARMAERIDAVGAALCIPVVDRYEAMRDSGPEGLPSLLAKDRFHMSPRGHRLLAEQIGQEILCALGRSCGR